MHIIIQPSNTPFTHTQKKTIIQRFTVTYVSTKWTKIGKLRFRQAWTSFDNFGKQHQDASKNDVLNQLFCPFTFIYFICFQIAATEMT